MQEITSKFHITSGWYSSSPFSLVVITPMVLGSWSLTSSVDIILWTMELRLIWKWWALIFISKFKHFTFDISFTKYFFELLKESNSFNLETKSLTNHSYYYLLQSGNIFSAGHFYKTSVGSVGRNMNWSRYARNHF